MTYSDTYSLREDNADFLDVADAIDQLQSDSTVGWQLVDETWTYASSTTITVPTGATGRFQKGDKLKLDNTSTKYFVVTNVTTTVLTVTGGTDYTVANSAITAIYVSRAERPFGFPAYFSYTPTYGAQAGSFSGTPTTNYARAKFIGNRIHIQFYFNGTLTTATADYLTMTSLAAASGGIYIHNGISGQNSTFSASCFALSVDTSSTFRIYRADGADWAIATFFVFGSVSHDF